jgi:hypothetical protein
MLFFNLSVKVHFFGLFISWLRNTLVALNNTRIAVSLSFQQWTDLRGSLANQ